VEDPVEGRSITYRELDVLSDTIGEMLVGMGVSSGDRVGIWMPKSIGAVAAIFGILKAKAAYVPIDHSAPAGRNVGILKDCGVRAVLIAGSRLGDLRGAWPDQPLPVLEELAEGILLVEGVTDDQARGIAAPRHNSSELAYILYTSGSTGKPKGVVHTHGSALAFVDWCSSVFRPTDRDRFSSHAPLHFDLSILDVFVAVKHAATLVLIGEAVGKQPQTLAHLISERRITVWYSTPSILRLLVEWGRLAELDSSALRLVLFAGEVFPIRYLRPLTDVWPHARFFNLYGPTETNVCTYFEIPREIPHSSTEPFPIGSPCSGDRVIIVDEQGREVPQGVPGELCVAGDSVMLGYWNRPDRTAEAFLIDDAGVRWYRTGDVAVRFHGDHHRFLGRRDRMIKRRGYRVELGEIESALHRHPGVREAAVVAVADEVRGLQIVACVAMADGSRPSLIAMKQYCSQELPLYMVPDRFAHYAALPKTSTDKIDYRQLGEHASPLASRGE
jgi:amino acid adenylation domain-containing protein